MTVAPIFIVIIAVVLIAVAIYALNRASKAPRLEVFEPSYIYVAEDGTVHSIPLLYLYADNTRLASANKKLHWALNRDPESQMRRGLCAIVADSYITSLCIERWVTVVGGALHVPCDASYYVFQSDRYKLRNPVRRELARYMLACIAHSARVVK